MSVVSPRTFKFCPNHNLESISMVQFAEKSVHVFCAQCRQLASSDAIEFKEEKFRQNIKVLDQVFEEILRKIIERFQEFKEKYYQVMSQMDKISTKQKLEKLSQEKIKMIKMVVAPNDRIISSQFYQTLREDRFHQAPQINLNQLRIYRMASDQKSNTDGKNKDSIQALEHEATMSKSLIKQAINRPVNGKHLQLLQRNPEKLFKIKIVSGPKSKKK